MGRADRLESLKRLGGGSKPDHTDLVLLGALHCVYHGLPDERQAVHHRPQRFCLCEAAHASDPGDKRQSLEAIESEEGAREHVNFLITLLAFDEIARATNDQTHGTSPTSGTCPISKVGTVRVGLCQH
ncbi:unnamed protein product [Effrenium voratum]|nr:unnamed protein product [Effrenium voratum]